MDPRHKMMREQYKQAVIVSAALFVSLPILGFVAWVMLADGPSSDTSTLAELGFLVVAFAIVAAISVRLSFRLMHVVLRAGAEAADKGMVTPNVAVYAVDGRVDPVDAFAANLMTANLVASAVSEIPLLLGFVLTLMTGQWFAFVGGAALTIFLWITHFPRFSRWEELVETEEARRGGAPQMTS